jgi:hypothetical protein
MNPFPSIARLAHELRCLKHNIDWTELEKQADEPGDVGVEVRLRVFRGGWELLDGDPCYDTDHHGWWGCDYLTPRANCQQMARQLIDEAREDRAMGGE